MKKINRYEEFTKKNYIQDHYINQLIKNSYSILY